MRKGARSGAGAPPPTSGLEGAFAFEISPLVFPMVKYEFSTCLSLVFWYLKQGLGSRGWGGGEKGLL